MKLTLPISELRLLAAESIIRNINDPLSHLAAILEGTSSFEQVGKIKHELDELEATILKTLKQVS